MPTGEVVVTSILGVDCFLVSVLELQANSANSATAVNKILMFCMAILLIVYRYSKLNSWYMRRCYTLTALIYIFASFKRRLFITTLTELNAIAAPAIIGSTRNPLTG